MEGPIRITVDPREPNAIDFDAVEARRRAKPDVAPGDLVRIVVRGRRAYHGYQYFEQVGDRVVWQVRPDGRPEFQMLGHERMGPVVCPHISEAAPGEMCWIETDWAVPDARAEIEDFDDLCPDTPTYQLNALREQLREVGKVVGRLQRMLKA